ncbi:MAG: YjcZ family sporulation protein [Bacilli bacterium]|nr:YjcZ family sporulation protein [Bacilli bacterium]MDD4035915.1 YjcZ family sporulation protein [Bacilli bacterium]
MTCPPAPCPSGRGYLIIIVLYILLAIILGAAFIC